MSYEGLSAAREDMGATHSFPCAWCGKAIREGAEIFCLGAKVSADHQGTLKGHEGELTSLPIHGRDIPAVVPGADSEAKKEGKDILFPICGMRCGKALDAFLQGGTPIS